MSSPDGVARRCKLPNDEFGLAWDSIMLEDGIRERLLAQALLSFTIRQKLPFENAPLHGLILLPGPPGTGKTTLARGLANQVAKHIAPTKATFVEIDAHALMSSSHGRSQQAVSKLFEQTIPEIAMGGVAIVLLDEVETLAVSRHQLSMDANPIDVHRATDAALAGMDRLTREHRNVLLIATTNFPKALDAAVLSRADHIESIGLPNLKARQEIISDSLRSLGKTWKGLEKLVAEAGHLAKVSEGLDGRRLRKEVLVAIGSSIETAKDPNLLTTQQLASTFQKAVKSQKELSA